MSDIRIVARVSLANGEDNHLIAECANELVTYLNATYMRNRKTFGEVEVVIKNIKTSKEDTFVFHLSQSDIELNPYFRWDRFTKILLTKIEKMG